MNTFIFVKNTSSNIENEYVVKSSLDILQDVNKAFSENNIPPLHLNAEQVSQLESGLLKLQDTEISWDVRD